MTHAEQSDQDEGRLSRSDFHWKAVIALIVFGVAACCFAFWVEVGLLQVDWPLIFEKDLGVVQSIAANLGTGFVSAGLLLLLEPYVKRVVRKVATEASDKATTKFDERIESLEDAFHRIERRVGDTIERQHRLVEKASKQFTNKNLMAVMNEALDFGAIADGQVSVQATDQMGEFVVTVACHEEPKNRILSPEEAGRRLRIMVTTSKGRAVQTWHREESFDEVAAGLLAELSRQKAWPFAVKVDWPKAMQRALEAVSLALASGNGEDDAIPLHGRLSEVIADGWFLTDQGLECPEQKFVLFGRDTFPPVRPTTYGSLGPTKDIPPAEGLRPSWADENIWNYAVDRCRQYFTNNITITGDTNDTIRVPRENVGLELP